MFFKAHSLGLWTTTNFQKQVGIETLETIFMINTKKKEKIEPSKIRIEQKALSSLQNYIQIQLHS